MRSEGFRSESGGLAAGPVFASFVSSGLGVRSVSSRCPLGVVVNSVRWGVAPGVSRVWRCAVGIAGGRVTCAALCRGDW